MNNIMHNLINNFQASSLDSFQPFITVITRPFNLTPLCCHNGFFINLCIKGITECDSLDLTLDLYSLTVNNPFLEACSMGITIIIYIVLLSNISDLLNPFTFEENVIAQRREEQYKIEQLYNKLINQRDYIMLHGRSTDRHIWWRGWNNIPNTKLNYIEHNLLMNLPTSRIYFNTDNSMDRLYANRFDSSRPCPPNLRSCPIGSPNVPTNAKVWLDVDVHRP